MGGEAGRDALDELSRVIREATKDVDEKMVDVRELLRDLERLRSTLTKNRSLAVSEMLKKSGEEIKNLKQQLDDVQKLITDARVLILDDLVDNQGAGLENHDVTIRPGGAQNRRRTVEDADSGVFSADSRVLSSNGILVTHPTGNMNQEMVRAISIAQTSNPQEHDEKEESYS